MIEPANKLLLKNIVRRVCILKFIFVIHTYLQASISLVLPVPLHQFPFDTIRELHI